MRRESNPNVSGSAASGSGAARRLSRGRRRKVTATADRAVLLLLICFVASGLGIHRALKVEAQEVLA
jgi:hypothetical protein